MMGKKGFFKFKATASTVSGIVVIVGGFVIWLSVQYNKPELLSTGIGFVIFGLIGALVMTLIIRFAR